jgi:oxygen-independent coproporphyrinogen-3 oxidase
MDQLRLAFEISEYAEITMEANPGTLTLETAHTYKRAGINRVSMGLQSTHDTTLKAIGRTHRYVDFLKSLEHLRNAGIEDINADLMFGLPGQTLEDWEETLETVVGLPITHISAYALKVEEGTPMEDWVNRGRIHLPDEDTERAMYHKVVEHLEKAGYPQYEISNFAKPNHACRHNLVYWHNKPYLGLGLAAHSKYENRRFSNTCDFDVYCTQLENECDAIVEAETIDETMDQFETIMLELRLNEGLHFETFGLRYGVDFEQQYHIEISELLKSGLLMRTDSGIRLTEVGRDLSNRVFLAFMPD